MVEGAEEDAEELSEVHVIGRFLEAQSAAVVEVHGEFGGEALRAQHTITANQFYGKNEVQSSAGAVTKEER